MATAVIKFCAMPSRRTMSERMNITAVTASTKPVMNLPSLLRLFSSGVGLSFAPVSMAAMAPISVCMPVANTTAVAVPLNTYEDENKIFFRAESGIFSPSTGEADFISPTLSPVNALSSHFKAAQANTRQSAGTISPSERLITSPGTSSSLFTCISLPALRHFTVHTESFFRFSMALSARYCCIVPTSAFKNMMNSIINVSVRSALSPEIMAIAAVIAAAAIRSIVITSLNWEINSFKKPALLPFSSAFLPYFCSRSFASSTVMPIGDEPRLFNTSSAPER